MRRTRLKYFFCFFATTIYLFLSNALPSRGQSEKPEIVIQNGHFNGISSICFSPDGKYLASGGGDNIIKLWDATSGRLLRTLEGLFAPIHSVCFSPDGKQLASGSADNTIKL